MNQTSQYGVIHIKPDWDAITFAYIARKAYGITNWKFVNQKTPDIDVINGAYIVGDVNSELDYDRLRIDHHQMPWNDQMDLCATSLLFDYLMSSETGRLQNAIGIAHLKPLVDLVTDGDTGKKTPVMQHSSLFGMHADLSDFIHNLNTPPTDQQILDWGFTYLKRKDRELWNDAEWTRKAQLCVTRSGYAPFVVMIENSNAKVTKKVLLTNKLVIFVNVEENMIGIQRQDGTKLNCGYVLKHMIMMCESLIYGREDLNVAEFPISEDGIQDVKNILNELTRKSTKWFAHESGFFAGRGTGGAKVDVPVTVNLDLLYYIVYRSYRMASLWS